MGAAAQAIWPPGDGEMPRMIQAHDWGATSLGPTTGWPISLRVTTELLVAHGFPMIALWGPDLVQIYNDGFRVMMGNKHPVGLGQPTRECWPEVWPINEPIYERIWRGETVTFEDALYPVGRHGPVADAWFTLSYSPLRIGMDVAGILITVLDVTARHLAERNRAEIGEQLRALATASTDVIYRMSPDWREMRALDGKGFIQDVQRPRASWTSTFILPEDQPVVLGAIEEALAGKRTFDLEHRVRRADGGTGWTHSRAVPLLDADGNVREWIGSASDITERKRAAESLRESEERFRQFADASSDALWVRDAVTLALEYVSPAFSRIYGIPPDGLLQDTERWALLIVEEDRGHALSQLARAQAGEAVAHEFRITRLDDGTIRWIRNTDFPLFDALGRVERVGGIAEDITGAKRSAGHQATLLAELQHRVRNTLAVIRSIARRTAASSETVDDYAQELDGRLGALARVQSVVTRNPALGVDLEYLVADELHAHTAREGRQLRIAGPVVRLQPKAAETLGLAIHELAVNAVKYGALATPNGRIRLTWHRSGSVGEENLFLTWKESGVTPTTLQPKRRGFGTELLTRTLAYELKAHTDYAIEPDGLRYTIDLPLSDKILKSEDPLDPPSPAA